MDLCNYEWDLLGHHCCKEPRYHESQHVCFACHRSAGVLISEDEQAEADRRRLRRRLEAMQVSEAKIRSEP